MVPLWRYRYKYHCYCLFFPHSRCALKAVRFAEAEDITVKYGNARDTVAVKARDGPDGLTILPI